MKFRNMLKSGLILGFGFGLAACGTYHHEGYHHHQGHGGGCVSAGDKALNKSSKVAQIIKKVKQPQVAQNTTKVISTSAHFGFDNATLNAQGKSELDKYAAFLAQNPETRIRVEGHTDEKGKATYNVALGKRRADSVASYLESQGVPKKSIEVYSYGAENPIDYGNTPQAYAKNRRVELFFEVDSDMA